MKRLLFLLLLIPVLSFGQKVYTYGGDAVTYNGEVVRTVVYCTEYQAVYDEYIIKPDDAIAVQQNLMVNSMVTEGVWAKLDIFYVLANNVQSSALINWKNPGAFTATEVDAPVFTAYEGYTGSSGAPNKYLTTGFTPSIHGTVIAQNSACVGVYSRTTGVENKTEMDSAGSIAYISIRVLYTGTNTGGYLNDVSFQGAPIVGNTGAGMYSLNRHVSNLVYKIMNGINYGNTGGVSNSTGLPDGEVTILRGGTANSNRQVSGAWLGGSLSDAEHLAFKNAFETYMDFLGNGVIP